MKNDTNKFPIKENKSFDELKTTKALAKILDEENLTEIELDNGKFKIKVARHSYSAGVSVPPQISSPVISHQPLPEELAGFCKLETVCKTETVCDYKNHPGAVKSPMVGVVYLAPEPSAPAFIKEGDNVKSWQTLLLVEAMKTFNPITAPKSGIIKKILVEDSSPVEFGEALVVIE